MADQSHGETEESELIFGMLFNPRGKWGYNVKLDYGDFVQHCKDLDDYQQGRRSTAPSPVYRDPNDEAQRALARATKRGVSGVTIGDLNDYWILVVPEPPNGWPTCVLPNALAIAGGLGD